MVKRTEEERQGDVTKRTEETPFATATGGADGLDGTINELTASSFQANTNIDRSADRTTSHSAGDRTDSFGDKSETALKRVAEKIINYDMTPVAQALARHLGIDLTNDGVQARNRRGISVIVHGPPGSGKTMISREVSQRYDCALLSLDQVIIDAIDNSQRSDFAQRAYHMCRDAMEKHLEEQRQAEADADHAAPTQPGKDERVDSSATNFVFV